MAQCQLKWHLVSLSLSMKWHVSPESPNRIASPPLNPNLCHNCFTFSHQPMLETLPLFFHPTLYTFLLFQGFLTSHCVTSSQLSLPHNRFILILYDIYFTVSDTTETDISHCKWSLKTFPTIDDQNTNSSPLNSQVPTSKKQSILRNDQWKHRCPPLSLTRQMRAYRIMSRSLFCVCN